jgi:NADH:ubiquinone reductase (H+-translocating)
MPNSQSSPPALGGQPVSSSAAARGARPRIVIVGAGFGGVSAAKALRRCDAQITLIDRRNHHIFQPLLYQVATGVLAPSEVAAPVRQLARRQRNLSVMMADVTGLDLSSRFVETYAEGVGSRGVGFDYLILAPGMQGSYFGRDEFATYAPSLKTIADAETIRSKILSAYELAELTDDPAERARLMTFVLVGAGPTGVELAASIAQMAKVTLRANFRSIDPAHTSILLIEGGARILQSFSEILAARAAQRLERLGVRIVTGAKVEEIDPHGVLAGGHRIASATVLWTAGVVSAPILTLLGCETDRAGRPFVSPLLSVPNHPGVFVVGDAAAVGHGDHALPGVAQVAIQQGAYVGRLIRAEIQGGPLIGPFRYSDKGTMAVVGANFAVLQRGRILTSGFLTWLIWGFIHLAFLPQVQNRLRVQIQWFWTYLTGQRSSRLIPEPGQPISGCGWRATTARSGSSPTSCPGPGSSAPA